MSKQLLIYKDIVPISSEKHSNWCLKKTESFLFAKDSNSFPLLDVEFFQAASIYPIVFIKTELNLYPSVIVGIKDEENLFVTQSGVWQADYIPAFVRRYPFIFSIGEDQQTFTVCTDELFEGWNQQGVGERLFDSEGNQTQYLNSVISFLQDYQAKFLGTEAFCQKLIDLDLLEDMQANLMVEGVTQPPLQGFSGVSREKLMGLTPEVTYELMQLGWLELIYLHLHSLNNFSTFSKMLSES